MRNPISNIKYPRSRTTAPKRGPCDFGFGEAWEASTAASFRICLSNSLISARARFILAQPYQVVEARLMWNAPWKVFIRESMNMSLSDLDRSQDFVTREREISVSVDFRRRAL